MRKTLVPALDLLLDPPALGRVLDVHVLDADRSAVRVPQNAEDVAEQHLPLVAAELAGDELAVEVPERQTVARDVEVGVRTLDILERVDVRHQVATHTERVDQLLHTRGLVDCACQVDADVRSPVDRVVRDAQRREDVLVEGALADQHLVHDLEELARTRTLDDPVVVGARQRDRLADRELGERVLARALEFSGVFECARPDDRSLAFHQAGDRVHRADAARVRERNRRAGEIRRRQLVGAGPGDEVFVRREVFAEAHRVRTLDARDEEGAGAVRFRQVDRDAQVDVGRRHDRRLAVELFVVHVLARELLERLDQ